MRQLTKSCEKCFRDKSVTAKLYGICRIGLFLRQNRLMIQAPYLNIRHTTPSPSHASDIWWSLRRPVQTSSLFTWGLMASEARTIVKRDVMYPTEMLSCDSFHQVCVWWNKIIYLCSASTAFGIKDLLHRCHLWIFSKLPGVQVLENLFVHSEWYTFNWGTHTIQSKNTTSLNNQFDVIVKINQ